MNDYYDIVCSSKKLYCINKIYTPIWDDFILKNKKHKHIAFKTLDIDRYGNHFINVISKTNTTFYFINKLIYSDYNNEYEDYGVVFHHRDFRKKLKCHNKRYL